MASAFTVEFDEKGQMIRAISAGIDNAKKGLGQEARARSGKAKLNQHKMKNITSLAIVTTENPHIVLYQGGRYIVLPH